MNKTRVANIINTTIDTKIPTEVRQWLKNECLVVVNNLSDWNITPSKHNAKGNELLGIFGFEDGKPVIGINHKALRTAREVIRITLHEIAHFSLWKMGLPNGERAANKLVKEWNSGN